MKPDLQISTEAQKEFMVNISCFLKLLSIIFTIFETKFGSFQRFLRCSLCNEWLSVVCPLLDYSRLVRPLRFVHHSSEKYNWVEFYDCLSMSTGTSKACCETTKGETVRVDIALRLRRQPPIHLGI